MHIIIVGCGRVGSQMSQLLSQEGHNVVIVDKNPSAFRRLGSAFNGITITGIGFDPDILKRAGVERADALAAVTNGDNSNIMTSQVARRIFKIPKVITRIYDPERAVIYRRFGLETICTTKLSAGVIKNMLLEEVFIYHIPIGKEHALIEFAIGVKYDGKTVKDINREPDFLATAIVRKGQIVKPDPVTELKSDDIIMGIAKSSSLKLLREHLGFSKVKTKNQEQV